MSISSRKIIAILSVGFFLFSGRFLSDGERSAAVFSFAAQQQNWVRYFEGTLNNRIKIVMKLKREGGELSGDYFYERYGAAISLHGRIDGQQNISLDELDEEGKVSARFKGKLILESLIDGTWAKGKTSMPFHLKEIDTTTGPAVSFQGDWNWENQGYGFSLELTQKGNQLKGSYCAVTRNATRIDCESEITGTISGRLAKLKFTSGYSDASGTAILIHRGDNLLWDITVFPDGEFFAPVSALVKKTARKK